MTHILYVDFDSCYYNVARRIFSVPPWTIITNKYNHMISVPHWLEGHFGVKKMTYFAPPIKARKKVKRFVDIFDVDVEVSGNTPRDRIKTLLEDKVELLRKIAPDAVLICKDSIVLEAELEAIENVRSIVALPCTIGLGATKDEAKLDCTKRKGETKKKRKLKNLLLLVFYTTPMLIGYLVKIIKEKRRINHEYLAISSTVLVIGHIPFILK